MKKMEECQDELKHTMLNSLMCLDFYKDLENYISENRYNSESEEALLHFAAIDKLIKEHGLNSIDFDTERIQQLVETIQDYVRVRAIEKKVIQIHIGQEDSEMSQSKCSSNEGNSMTDNNGLKFKVTKVNRQPFNMNTVAPLPIGITNAYNASLTSIT